MERIRRNLSFANVAAALALMFSMSGGAIAATGGFASGGKLQACVNEEGAIRLLKPGKKCKRGQTAVAWNQSGATGATGATGAAGAAGAKSAEGAKGLEGPKGVEGLKGTSGEPTNVKWATVDDDGFIQSSHGAVAAVQSGNHFTVAFDKDVSKCAIVATQNGTDSPLEISAKPAGTEVTVTIREGSTFIATDFSLVVIC
jgi:hypothetical protein